MAHVIWSGVCSNDTPSNTILTDILSYFDTMELDSDIVIDNVTDGSTARFVSVTDSNNLLTDGLTGGSDNQFTSGDLYNIRIATAYQSGTLEIQYHYQKSFDFATRIIDVRWNARMRFYETQRRGVVAEYKNAWTPLPSQIDKYHGNAIITDNPPFTIEKVQGNVTTDFYRDNNPVRNMGVLFGPTQKIRLMYVTPTEQTVQTQWGLVSTGNVMIGAPLSHPFRRGDVFRIHGKTWQVYDVPAFEFWQNKEIIGYQLLCVPIHHQQISW